MSVLLQVSDLTVRSGGRRGLGPALVRGIELTVTAGETIGVVGESGSGKTLTALSLMGLLPSGLTATGSIVFDGTDLLTLPERQLRSIRGNDIAMVYQDPMTSLDPFHRIGAQIAEALTAHGVSPKDAGVRTQELLGRVGIPDPVRTARAYPHEFSGGMRQRVVIAMALANRPRLLIADEPTTALDVTIQQQILALVDELRRDTEMTTIWVTHDLGVVARLVDRVLVMYAGRIVEDAPVQQIFAAPQHPYTARLLASLPRPGAGDRGPLAQIPGRPPAPGRLPAGCTFAPRCPSAQAICAVEPPLVRRESGWAACHFPPAEWDANANDPAAAC